MVSSNIFVAISLVLLPVAVYSYTCHYSDTTMNLAYTECNTNGYCSKVTAFDNNNNIVKESKSCDNGICQGNKCYTTTNDAGYHSEICCCTGDFCNGATTKSLLALPVMLLTYIIFK